MTLSEHQQAFMLDLARLVLYIESQGYACTGGELWRTPEMAEIYAAKGIGIKNSLHCQRLAIDLNLFGDGVYLTDKASWEPFGKYWVTLGPLNRWGGDWDKDGVTEPGENDYNHVERKVV